jgi:hypothetical protein
MGCALEVAAAVAAAAAGDDDDALGGESATPAAATAVGAVIGKAAVVVVDVDVEVLVAVVVVVVVIVAGAGAGAAADAAAAGAVGPTLLASLVVDGCVAEGLQRVGGGMKLRPPWLTTPNSSTCNGSHYRNKMYKHKNKMYKHKKTGIVSHTSRVPRRSSVKVGKTTTSLLTRCVGARKPSVPAGSGVEGERAVSL